MDNIYSEQELEVVNSNKVLSWKKTLEVEINNDRVKASSEDGQTWTAEIYDYDGSTFGRCVFNSENEFYLYLNDFIDFANSAYGEKYSKYGEMPTMVIQDNMPILTLENLYIPDEAPSRPYVQGVKSLDRIVMEKYWAQQDAEGQDSHDAPRL